METNKGYRDIWILGVTLAIFVVWKLSTLSFRFGDENVYFYMSNAVLHGLIPYKDFAFADPPFFIYLLAGFKALIGSHLILFKTLPVLFDGASAVLIYLLLKNKNKFAVLAPILYLFSFTVLSTSDYVTGAEVMVFLMLLAIWLDQHKKSFWSGVFWALACLSKLYAGPALIGFLVYKLFTKDFEGLKSIIIGGGVASALVLFPFFIIAPHQTFANLIVHQLHRPAGLNKWNIFGVFVDFEWLLIISCIAGIYVAKNKKFAYPLIFSLLFFLIFKDLYYLYLHILLPFIVILTVEFVSFLDTKREEVAWVFLVIYACVSIYNVSTYVHVYAPEGIFHQPQEIALALQNAPGNYPVYGAQEVAPLVALMSGEKLFDNIIDTNTQNFLSGAEDKDAISNAAVQTGVYLVARVANYPDQNIHDTGFEDYFDKSTFDNSCTPYKSFDRVSPGDPLNQVAIYSCILYTH